jgi:curli production assembly/transport component CsgF
MKENSMRVINIATLTAGIIIAAAGSSYASQLVYKPVNPSFGGDPQNGNWLLSQASAQGKAASGSSSSSPGFSIDFPNFGGVTQPATTTPTTLPAVSPTTTP